VKDLQSSTPVLTQATTQDSEVRRRYELATHSQEQQITSSAAQNEVQVKDFETQNLQAPTDLFESYNALAPDLYSSDSLSHEDLPSRAKPNRFMKHALNAQHSIAHTFKSLVKSIAATLFRIGRRPASSHQLHLRATGESQATSTFDTLSNYSNSSLWATNSSNATNLTTSQGPNTYTTSTALYTETFAAFLSTTTEQTSPWSTSTTYVQAPHTTTPTVTRTRAMTSEVMSNATSPALTDTASTLNSTSNATEAAGRGDGTSRSGNETATPNVNSSTTKAQGNTTDSSANSSYSEQSSALSTTPPTPQSTSSPTPTSTAIQWTTSERTASESASAAPSSSEPRTAKPPSPSSSAPLSMPTSTLASSAASPGTSRTVPVSSSTAASTAPRSTSVPRTSTTGRAVSLSSFNRTGLDGLPAILDLAAMGTIRLSLQCGEQRLGLDAAGDSGVRLIATRPVRNPLQDAFGVRPPRPSLVVCNFGGRCRRNRKLCTRLTQVLLSLSIPVCLMAASDGSRHSPILSGEPRAALAAGHVHTGATCIIQGCGRWQRVGPGFHGRGRL
jgi:hypothetical protein